MAEIYQNTYGVNIDLEMREHGQTDMAFYLESRGIIERYVTILNGLKNCVKEGWSLELVQ
jgi:hypothetical protein